MEAANDDRTCRQIFVGGSELSTTQRVASAPKKLRPQRDCGLTDLFADLRFVVSGYFEVKRAVSSTYSATRNQVFASVANLLQDS